MIVRFEGSAGHEQRVKQGSDALHDGAEYIVLEVFCQNNGANFFRIEYSEDELPAMFDARLFKVLDPQLSASWTASLLWDGSIEIGPEAWHASGFWEAFIDREEAAVAVYLAERSRLHGE